MGASGGHAEGLLLLVQAIAAQDRPAIRSLDISEWVRRTLASEAGAIGVYKGLRAAMAEVTSEIELLPVRPDMVVEQELAYAGIIVGSCQAGTPIDSEGFIDRRAPTLLLVHVPIVQECEVVTRTGQESSKRTASNTWDEFLELAPYAILAIQLLRHNDPFNRTSHHLERAGELLENSWTAKGIIEGSGLLHLHVEHIVPWTRIDGPRALHAVLIQAHLQQAAWQIGITLPMLYMQAKLLRSYRVALFH